MLKLLTKPRRKQSHVGPQDDGKKMSLSNFDEAIAQEGYCYELGKGSIEVSGIPDPSHLAQVQQIRNQLIIYQAANTDLVHTVAGSNESKILVMSDQSERHPDISVYLSAPPDTKDVWSKWVPAIVVEVVSKSSIKRDYEDKPSEYLAFGIDEYWIVDSFKQQMTVHTRWRGQWKTKIIKSSQKHSPLRLPGFTLDLKKVFAAAK
jgi:Uma2 family endonuclease